MLVSLVVCMLGTIRVDLPIVVSAQAPPSNVETFIVPWTGVRVGVFDNDNAGAFQGLDGQLLVGFDSQGTNEVAVLRVPVLLEGRGLIGGRWRGGLVGVAGYGFGGFGVGVGVSSFKAFDDERLRGFALLTLRSGGGVEFAFGPAFTRIEVGAGLRNSRFEVAGTFAVGGAW